MRVSYWWCALLMLGNSHLACADEAATDDAAPSMEVIEMLGEMDGEVVDLEIAMSNVKVDEMPATRDVNADEKPSAQEEKNAK
jgi:hypothetical protein